MSQTNALGSFLRAARNQKKLSLRAVEELSRISNAYLSQIESGKIRQPSPNMLHKLCEIYDISYTEVMQLAGYPIPSEQPEEQGHGSLATNLGPVTEEEEQALIEYLAFLRSRRPGRGG